MDHKTRILVTGGTGSFGQAFVKKIINLDSFDEIIVFSRDELKQFEMHSQLNNSKVKYVLGDIRDLQRLEQVARGVDVIVHAAANKQVVAAELNPMEAIKTNIIGAENVVNIAIKNGIKKVIALSTDKAANPANLYGATKLCADKLFIAGNFLTKSQLTSFSVVRYGNVIGSRGSVIPFFIDRIKSEFIPITHLEMTRFWLTLNQGVEFVLKSLNLMQGGEIFVPKIPSFKVSDVAKIIAPDTPIKVIGIRPGEKLHEVMITEDDAGNTYDFDDYYAILPAIEINTKKYDSHGIKVKSGFSFTSNNNPQWYSLDSFKALLHSLSLIE
jgi:UDP-N-acetylglucosamine 4,6-dehydratase